VLFGTQTLTMSYRRLLFQRVKSEDEQYGQGGIVADRLGDGLDGDEVALPIVPGLLCWPIFRWTAYRRRSANTREE
jgi:hypothetical protein